ncbi:MAG: peptidylprolyl isomerase [Oscillospiraceae bacterium]|nr:peptidylprolyl isomerase [Oscillospiraceae bacterium]
MMFKRKNLSAVLLAALGMAVFSGCKGEPMASQLIELEQPNANATPANGEPAATREILNFNPPQAGEKIAVITVKDFGDIKIKLFPEALPKEVENFVGLAESGYYDELIFHRIIEEFMNQGGDPKGNGTGGESLGGGKIDGDVSPNLYHFSGAVAYARPQHANEIGSQFYIVNTNPTLADVHLAGMPASNVKAKYLEVGGTPFLDGEYTVFGQVFEGMEVVREMAKVETDASDKPLKQVLIEKIAIVEYQS